MACGYHYNDHLGVYSFSFNISITKKQTRRKGLLSVCQEDSGNKRPFLTHLMREQSAYDSLKPGNSTIFLSEFTNREHCMPSAPSGETG